MIGDIRYEPRNGPSWLVCTDGTRLDAPTPDALAILWTAHGGNAQRAETDVAAARGRRPHRKLCRSKDCTKAVLTTRHSYCITHGKAA